MNRLAYLLQKPSSYIIVTILYVGVFALNLERVGERIASLAIIPIISSYALIVIIVIVGKSGSISVFNKILKRPKKTYE